MYSRCMTFMFRNLVFVFMHWRKSVTSTVAWSVSVCMECSRVNVHYGHQSCMLYLGSLNKNLEYVLLLKLLYIDCIRLDLFNFLIRSQRNWSECNYIAISVSTNVL